MALIHNHPVFYNHDDSPEMDLVVVRHDVI